MSEEELESLQKLKELLAKYGEYYKADPMIYDYVRQNFLIDLESGKPLDANRAIFEELGLNNKLQKDYYKNFIKYMKKEMGIDKNLLEVGCGILPALANRISKEQSSGSVTVMDPKVIESYEGNIEIIKKEFTIDTDVSKYDLIYGFYPCEATLTMIKSSFKNDKDLFLELCGCSHGVPSGFKLNKKDASEYVIYLRYIEYIEYLLEQLSSPERDYEILKCPDLSYDIIKTYKPKNFY